MDTVQVVAEVLQVSDSLTHLGIGWSNIGDDELLTLTHAIRIKKSLEELWMEGNRVSPRGLLSLNDLTPYPLKKVVAIWNDLNDKEPESWCSQESITVTFTDDEETWEAGSCCDEIILRRVIERSWFCALFYPVYCTFLAQSITVSTFQKGLNVRMIDTERGPDRVDAGPTERSSKDKDTDTEKKKKRSRVKQLLGDVKKQVEFWFGDVNLHKDRFLRKLMDEADDGYVDISVLTSFNRMKKLTTDTKLIARALKNSSVVEVNLEGTKVRRQFPVGDIPNDTDSRTVYVELLPKDVTHSWIERVFTKCGNVVYVSIPRYKTSGEPKGFAFVEFETEEQAQKAIEMLNNPPEDAPRKPGIFPKTKNRKQLPLPVDNPQLGEEEEEKKKKKKKKKRDSATVPKPAEEAKEQMMEAQPSEQKRKHSGAGDFRPEVASSTKTAGKLSEKKRRRSQTVEGPESELPSKMRKTSESESGLKEKDVVKADPPTQIDMERGVEEGKENRDDSAVKVKRKRKKMHKEKLKIGEEVIPLRVLSKKEWLVLKEEYLTLQKHSMTTLKRCITKIDQKRHKSLLKTEKHHQDLKDKSEKSEKSEKATNKGPQFTSGVIIKITDVKPLPGRKFIKDALSKISPVAYIDILEGDAEGHIRFHTPEEAKAVSAVRAEIQREHSWKLEILSGDHEQRYWQKILVDRQVKLNRPREKKRGTEKLISKAEKIIIARAKEANKHIRFQED
ncbi:la-related protein 7 [Solea senegalensis]|uniref:La-related protein 7 n=1 Tax=Solea senegalensis TaxID=28829 RepID=A0AAV6QW63_SOLSE|nr:la-related protein 7 [Solea senegalensis]